MSLPRGRPDGQPARGRDGSGWRCPRAGPWAAAARTPGAGPRAWRAGIGLGEAGAAVPRRWACSPDRVRASRQPDPARGMIRIRRPDSGKPTAHQIVWETGGTLKGLRLVRANPAAIWMTWRLAASGPPLTPRSVRGEGEAAGLILLSSCLPAPGRQRGPWQHVPLYCPAYPGQDACVASQARPASRRARRGALRPGDRKG